MTANPLVKRWRAGGVTYGVGLIIPSAAAAQLFAHAGFDWLMIDMEHGPISIETAHAMIAATAGNRDHHPPPRRHPARRSHPIDGDVDPVVPVDGLTVGVAGTCAPVGARDSTSASDLVLCRWLTG